MLNLSYLLNLLFLKLFCMFHKPDLGGCNNANDIVRLLDYSVQVSCAKQYNNIMELSSPTSSKHTGFYKSRSGVEAPIELSMTMTTVL